jgi:hypothetical protein
MILRGMHFLWALFLTMACPLMAVDVTIGFEGPPTQPDNTHFAIAQYDEAGFHFQPIGTLDSSPPYRMGRVGPNTAGRPSNGTTHLALLYGDSCVVTRADAGTLTVKSVQIAEYSIVVSSAKTVTFTGYKSNGSTVTTSFTTDGIIDGPGGAMDYQTFVFPNTFSGLVRMEFSDIVAYDNMVLSADLPPEPQIPVSLWVSPVTLTIGISENRKATGSSGALSSTPARLVLGNDQVIAAAVERGDIPSAVDWKLYVLYENELLSQRMGSWVFELRNSSGKRVSLAEHLSLEALGETRSFTQKKASKTGNVSGSLVQDVFYRNNIDLGEARGVVQAYGKVHAPYTISGTVTHSLALSILKQAAFSGAVNENSLVDVNLKFGKWHGESGVLLPAE